MPKQAKIYIGAIIMLGAVIAGLATLRSLPSFSVGLLVYLGLSFAAGLVKVRLPGITGTYSLVFLPTLAGIAHFGLAATLIAGVLGTVAQTLIRTKKRPTLVQLLFNIGNLTLSTAAAAFVHDGLMAWGGEAYRPAVMALVAAVYFVTNTCLVSGILSLLQGTPLAQVCETWYVWSFPYYLIGATLVGLEPRAQPEACLILFPLAYLVHFFWAAERMPASEDPAPDNILPRSAAVFALAIITAGLFVLTSALTDWACDNPVRFLGYLVLGLVTATWKVRLPGMTGTISVGFVSVLVAVLQLQFAEIVIMSALVGVAQCMWRPARKPSALQVLFNAACLLLSSGVADLVCRKLSQPMQTLAVRVSLATVTLYLTNTILVSIVLCLAAGAPLRDMWQRCYFWSFPYYLVGSLAAAMMISTAGALGWQASLAVMPIMALVYVSYRAHLKVRRVTVTA